jgi:hypothetical protein
MADETVATWANLLREQRGPLVEAIKWTTVLMSEIERDMDHVNWDGEKVRVPMILAPLQGTAAITETTTLSTPRTVDTAKAFIDAAIVTIPISFSTKLMNQSRTGGGNSWAAVIPKKMELAEKAYKRVINEQMMGSGDALIAACFAAEGASGGATQQIEVGPAANFHQLYEGRIVDVKNRTTGAVVGTGPVKILSYDEAAGMITVQYPDGTNTSFATATTDGVFIESSTRAPAGAIVSDAMQGLGEAASDTGTFQGLARSTTPQWKALVDGNAGVGRDLNMPLLDKVERKLDSRAGDTPTFYLGDPAVIDRYQQGFTVQAQWAGDTGQLETGWTGVRYRNKVLIRENDAPAKTLYGVHKEDFRIYTLDDGPDWDEKDGSMFKRFSRALPLEAWLVWMLELGCHRCVSQARVNDLNQAA